VKRKWTQSSAASEGVTSAQSSVTPAQPSANVGSKLSTNTDTSTAVDTNLGPAAKRSRRTTLSHAKRKKSDDAATPAAVLFADVRRRDVAESGKKKQTTNEDVDLPQTTSEDVSLPQDCKIPTVVFYLIEEHTQLF